MTRRFSTLRARRADPQTDAAAHGAETMSPFVALALSQHGHLFPPQPADAGSDRLYFPTILGPALDVAVARFWLALNSHVDACDGGREGVVEQ